MEIKVGGKYITHEGSAVAIVKFLHDIEPASMFAFFGYIGGDERKTGRWNKNGKTPGYMWGDEAIERELTEEEYASIVAINQLDGEWRVVDLYEGQQI